MLLILYLIYPLGLFNIFDIFKLHFNLTGVNFVNKISFSDFILLLGELIYLNLLKFVYLSYEGFSNSLIYKKFLFLLALYLKFLFFSILLELLFKLLLLKLLKLFSLSNDISLEL